MTRRIKLRTLVVGGVITLLFVVLLSKVYWEQVVRADFWSDKAREIWSRSETLDPVRGTITDRDGNILAMDVAAYTVAVNPKVIHELGLEDIIVSKLHNVLGKSETELRKLVTAKKSDGTYYQQREVRPEGWKIDTALYDRLIRFREELREQAGSNDVGLSFIEDTKRFYPKQTMAAQILGYTNRDGAAVGGLESYLNKELSGEAGKITYERDGNGVILENGTVEFKPSRDGSNVQLTIDTEIQHYVEEAIQEVYEQYQPKSITAIAADPQTMEILGMANLPSYNPNEYWDSSAAGFYNHVIQSQYEPGSTFKIVTLAAAVQEGLFNPNATYKSGSIRVADSTLRDIKREGWGEITYLEGLKRSSNVAFVKLGYEMLKADKLVQYIENFGFGVKTGIELPGEINGRIAIRKNYATEVATAAFGQGRVSVTPIQQVAAVAAVANGGKLLQPHIIKEIDDPVTSKKTVTQPKVVRQVISAETSKKTSEYLEQVVADQEIGTGKKAYIPGYRVAGKTGTAQKVGSNGEYSDDKYVVSFIGFAPVGNPKIIVYVVVDEPNDKYAGGGSVAAPVFKKIVEQSLKHMGVSPALPEGQKTTAAEQKEVTIKVPDMKDNQVANAKQKLVSRSLSVEVLGTGKTVKQQIPAAGTQVSPTQKIYLLTEERDKLSLPNLIGLSLRDALEMCSLLGIRAVTAGEGFVSNQMLAKLNGERVVKLTLSPPGPDDGTEESTAGSGDAGADTTTETSE
ncbi:penicillin-binding protein 2B [Paenibacillus phyllosphaerae]|uniref:Penicillin-binding protein 2B n=1 Tax=Paenibacillus phyllosphaerae TaxID=274593 RepID=A0A7W5AVI6_9BACL|nr:penicillin-binding transpeptidase domain-containing protein [Paenibacillus phyllosphaerae]MBB3109051.1 penicillin-binding protein 2B [Paenibacillus phyllosphaerae]